MAIFAMLHTYTYKQDVAYLFIFQMSYNIMFNFRQKENTLSKVL